MSLYYLTPMIKSSGSVTVATRPTAHASTLVQLHHHPVHHRHAGSEREMGGERGDKRANVLVRDRDKRATCEHEETDFMKFNKNLGSELHFIVGRRLKNPIVVFFFFVKISRDVLK
jgi:hypothetical protein